MKIKRILQAIISLVVVIATLMAVSCGENIVPTETQYPSGTSSTAPTNSSENTKNTKNTEPMPTTSSQKIDEPIVWKNGYLPVKRTFCGISGEKNDIDMESKILIFERIGNYSFALYYSKVDRQIYPFCFDPLCEHDSETCIARLLHENSKCPVLYVNDRLYFVKENTIFSCSNVATDLREEKSIGSYVEMFTDYSDAIQNMISDGNFIFIEAANEEGRRIWYRYDTQTRKIINTQEFIDRLVDTQTQEGGFVTAINGKIVFSVYNVSWSERDVRGVIKNHPTYEFDGMYITDYDFENINKTDIDFVPEAERLFTTDSGIIYINSNHSKDNLRFDLNLFSLDNYETTTLIENYPTNWRIIYLRNNFIYYVIVSSNNDDGDTGNSQHIFNLTSGELYRYDIETGKSVCVMKNGDYIGTKIIYLDDENFLAITRIEDGYNQFRGKYTDSQYFLFGDINEDGNFINVNAEKIIFY